MFVKMIGEQGDPMLEQHRYELIVVAAKALDKAQMIRFSGRTGTLSATDLGRTASHFYIKYDTVEVSALNFGYICFLDISF